MLPPQNGPCKVPCPPHGIWGWYTKSSEKPHSDGILKIQVIENMELQNGHLVLLHTIMLNHKGTKRCYIQLSAVIRWHKKHKTEVIFCEMAQKA